MAGLSNKNIPSHANLHRKTGRIPKARVVFQPSNFQVAKPLVSGRVILALDSILEILKKSKAFHQKNHWTWNKSLFSHQKTRGFGIHPNHLPRSSSQPESAWATSVGSFVPTSAGKAIDPPGRLEGKGKKKDIFLEDVGCGWMNHPKIIWRGFFLVDGLLWFVDNYFWNLYIHIYMYIYIFSHF